MRKTFVALLCLVLFACGDSGLNHQPHKVKIESLSVTIEEARVVESTRNEGEHKIQWKVSTEQADNRYAASLYLSKDESLDVLGDSKIFGSLDCSPNNGSLNSNYCSDSTLTCNYNHEMLLSCEFASGDFQGAVPEIRVDDSINVSKSSYYILKACHYDAPEICVSRSVDVTFM